MKVTINLLDETYYIWMIFFSIFVFHPYVQNMFKIRQHMANIIVYLPLLQK
jgi:hypothetical protein